MKQFIKPVGVFMAVLVFLVSIPYQTALAAMVDTESVLGMNCSRETRDFLKNMLAREDVQNALIAHGIHPKEAEARIDSLSDAEVRHLAANIEQIPAGGGAVETFIVLAFVAFLILLVTDILGYTDIFPFVKPKKQ